MFVRFRTRNGRLLASLVESHRLNGKPRQHHIADLGAIDEPPSVNARLVYWRELHARLARLGNRVPADKFGAILGAVQARIPMVTIEEQRLAREAAIETNLSWWQSHLDMSTEQVAAHQRLKDNAEHRIEAWTGVAETARANIAAAKAARNDPDKPASAELTVKEMQRIWREAAWTKHDTYRARKLGALSDEEFEARLARRGRRHAR